MGESLIVLYRIKFFLMLFSCKSKYLFILCTNNCLSFEYKKDHFLMISSLKNFKIYYNKNYSLLYEEIDD